MLMTEISLKRAFKKIAKYVIIYASKFIKYG